MTGAPSDLLVSGDERPPRRWSRSSRRAAALVGGLGLTVIAGVGVGAVVEQDRARQEQRRAAAEAQDEVRLSLLQPGQERAPRYGPRRPGVHLVVGNDGPATVRLLSGVAAPGTWQLQVPAGRELRAGFSLRLELTPPVGCDSAAPRTLVVRAVPPSGRPRTVVVDLSGAHLAYGGRLTDAVSSHALTCDPTAGDATA